MNTGRQLRNDFYLALKAATRRLLKQVGGQESGATITRVSHQHLSKCGNPHIDDVYIPVDVLADLEVDAGAPFVTKVLAQASGYVLVPIPQVEGSGVWVERVGRLSKEAGEAIARICEALADDNDITAKESVHLKLRKELADVLEAVAEIDTVLERLEAEGDA